MIFPTKRTTSRKKKETPRQKVVISVTYRDNDMSVSRWMTEKSMKTIEKHITKMRVQRSIANRRMSGICGVGIYENRYYSRNSRKLMPSRSDHLHDWDRLLRDYRATRLRGCFRRLVFHRKDLWHHGCCLPEAWRLVDRVGRLAKYQGYRCLETWFQLIWDNASNLLM